ncbi:hypothetical protein BCR32DRAFT_279199 [Anaeromyces robustus]|uniref:Uncharacterized protein n=1 Tax=Anaeromyces robustus TaxID=1754192 RepID=A0A1Y1X8R0_9FUNG|nr:hypothetical protein BCR32DRAFT_279199 [Anaeromyces robustus]|eukprot:ORX82112.1 hypothetical protein BCR32DRAFT_279199 [Anaeromyces robustus]
MTISRIFKNNILFENSNNNHKRKFLQTKEENSEENRRIFEKEYRRAEEKSKRAMKCYYYNVWKSSRNIRSFKNNSMNTSFTIMFGKVQEILDDNSKSLEIILNE